MLRWTEDQQREYEQRMGRTISPKAGPKTSVKSDTVTSPTIEPAPTLLTPKQRTQALGRMRTGEMNKTEARYAKLLEYREHAREIAWWKFESVKLRLADKTTYTADFFVMLITGELEVHEVKGYWEEDARIKIKLAAELYPFRFLAVKWLKDDSRWSFEDFSPWYNKEPK